MLILMFVYVLGVGMCLYKFDFDKIELLVLFDIINYIYICGIVIIDDFFNNDFMVLILLKIN